MNKAKTVNLIVILCVVVLDQVTKLWALQNLYNGTIVNFVPGVIEFVFRKNTGMAFSMFDTYPNLLFVLVTVIISVLSYYVLTSTRVNLGLACIVGGGIGNLVDRFARGYVIDFINPVFIDFAVFNIADVFLNIGVALIILEQLFARNNEAKS